MISPLNRSRTEPFRTGLSSGELWLSDDQGIIKCWELGRKMAEQEPELAERAKNGELPVLVWKGGVETALKIPLKYGTFRYLATWQGLRGEDLRIDPTKEAELTCTKTGVRVIYTSDSEKYSAT